MRGPHGDRADVEAAILEEEPRRRGGRAVLGQRDPHRHGQVAGAAAELVIAPAATPRLRRRIASIPSNRRSSARISTAAGDPCASVTTFTRQWMP